MTCKDCIHYDVCEENDTQYSGLPFSIANDKPCKFFKDKSRFIELPCKVGDTFYCLTQTAIKGELSNEYFIDERQVSCFEYDGKITIYDYDGIDFSIDNIFFDKSKAKAKLKELNEK